VVESRRPTAEFPARRSDQGETLVEVLLAVVVIGLTVVALLGGLVTSITASAEHQSISSIDALLKSYAETAKFQIELQPTVASPPSAPLFQDCSGTGSPNAVLNAYNSRIPNAPPAGYTIAITKLQPWNTVLNTWDGACSISGPNHDANGLQLLTIKATAPNAVSDQMQVVVRNPDYPTATPNPYAGF
jgi:type II secretory pathway pseudopilin PulG